MKSYAHRSIVTGRYKTSRPSDFKTNVFIMCSIAMTVLSVHYRAHAQTLFAMATPAQAAEIAVEETWEQNNLPCVESETDVVCIISETSHAAPVKAVKSPSVVKAGAIPQKYWDLATKICTEQKQDKVECPRYLLAVATVESVFGTKMVGDGGLSQGWFHIYHIHNKTVSLECKMDFYCSGTWSLKRMIEHGYNNPKMREWAVASHNSTTPEQNAIYLGMVKEALKKIK